MNKGTELLTKVDEDSKLVAALSSYPFYRNIFDKFLNASPDEFSIDDEFYKVFCHVLTSIMMSKMTLLVL